MGRSNQHRRSNLRLEPLEHRRVLAQLLPDLFAWEGESNNYLHDYRIEGDLLRFSTALANGGDGHLEIRGGAALPSGNQEVFQRIYDTDGSFEDTLAGEFTYHPSHSHIHFDGYASYNLRDVADDGTPGDIVATGGKVSFCLIDIRRLPGNSTSSNYGGCGSVVQGISAGWTDVYGSGLSDQWVNISTVPDGDYFLEITVDPDDQLIESDETNNVTTVPVSIDRGGTSTGDIYEDNDTFGTAADLGIVAFSDTPGLSIHTETDVDYFEFVAADSGQLDASILFTQSLGDLDLAFYDANQNLIAESSTTNDLEEISATVVAGDTYFIKVESPSSDINGYDLEIDGPGVLTTTTVSSTDPNLSISIPDDGPAITSTLEGPDMSLSDVNLVIENLNHTYLGDLRIQLTSPAGTTTTLLRAGNESPVEGFLGSDENFVNTVIDDQSPAFLGNANAPFTGAFNVNHQSVGDSPLAVFNGENAEGTWTISVQDRWGSDTGSLNAWGIQFSGVDTPDGDRFENNNDFPFATDLGTLGSTTESDLSIHEADDTDFFRFEAEVDGYASVNALFDHAGGDIELVVYDANLIEIGRSQSSTDNESLDLLVGAGELYYVEVAGVSGGTNDNYGLNISATAPSGDLNGDGDINATDVELFCDAHSGSSMNFLYDLNADGVVDGADGETLVFDMMGMLPGDADFDGTVDISDFNIWNENKFTNGCYTEGDFNFDNAIDNSDFNVWNENKFTTNNPFLVGPEQETVEVQAVAQAATAASVYTPGEEEVFADRNLVPVRAGSVHDSSEALADRVSVIDRVFGTDADDSQAELFGGFELDW